MKNLGNLMKQAQDMQRKMGEMQEKMKEMEISGTSGGGMVEVVINGKGEMRRLSIDKSIVDPEDKEMIEDLVVAAFNDAKGKAEEAMQEQMQEITGGLKLPPGMNLPF
ncbi:YbaB/EbfC family nucleoid-associated protein [Roseospira navarrensis]|uniref:Nucleoid-associated protein GHC57_05700 n=1 Tax=Roseospira navarrensis TaxID=140058 RepID=A0A7X2D4B2_9PROT|nr:YbaB/EbfC family nucleoid-associated protein [Roseospira navarrensis]MQX36010.1 YbaB/EbfC family nucleoid-associated protein [Roseospira navarrensis]